MQTSRSMIETYQRCPRKRYLNTIFGGKGIVPIAKDIALSTGIAVHKGVQVILEDTASGFEPSIDKAVKIALFLYDSDTAKGLGGKGIVSDDAMHWTIAEQRALIEALIRVWAARELPAIRERYEVLTAEKEIGVPLNTDVELMTKVDAILQERESGDIFCYSLKTSKQMTWRTKEGYAEDLQTLTEILGAERYLFLHNQDVEILKTLRTMKVSGAERLSNRVTGTRFCFLVKGQRWERDTADGQYYTDSPLLRGWQRWDEMLGKWIFAHSDKRVEPNNKSGFGKLLKKDGWREFNVWECGELGATPVKTWVEMLLAGGVQPDLGPIDEEIIWRPPAEYFRHDSEIAEALEDITRQEEHVRELVQIGRLDANFPMFRHSCLWPDKCEYRPICWGKDSKGNMVDPLVQDDPIASGWYEARRSHYEMERQGE